MDGETVASWVARGWWHDARRRRRRSGRRCDLIGKEQYHEVGEFPVERGYVWTSCASVENGNPLFWDDEVADALTDGPIAPPVHGLGLVPAPPLGARAAPRRRCRCRCTST